MLLSKVTLGKFKKRFNHCPTSLILSTSRFRVSLGWKYWFWRITYAKVGGYTDGSWLLYSAHRLDMVIIPALHSCRVHPRGNVRQVIYSTISSGRHVPTPFEGESLLVDPFFTLGVTPPYFILPYLIFFLLCWRRLSLDKMLHFLDYPPLIFCKIKSKQRQYMLAWSRSPHCVLSHFLRRFFTGCVYVRMYMGGGCYSQDSGGY